MYRLLLPILISIIAAACSLSGKQVGFGYAGGAPGYNSTDDQYVSPSLAQTEKSDAKTRRKRVAALRKNNSRNGAKRARAGEFANRDYRRTSLDVYAALESINTYRRSKGLKSVTLDASLTEAARSHSRDLAKWDRISHYGSDGSNPLDRVRRSGYRARIAAENVGTGQSTFREVLKGWKRSPGDDRNLLLKDAQHIGIALVKDRKTEFKTFWTLVVAARS